MNALNRNRSFSQGCPMRGVRAAILCLLTALALAGCMRRSAPVAIVEPQGELDSFAYGPSYRMAPAPAAAAYAAAAPTPVAHDAAYRLDAGDKLRGVGYGPEGLTNTHAIDAGGSGPPPPRPPAPPRPRNPPAAGRHTSR